MNDSRVARAADPADESEAASFSERLLRYARNGETAMIRLLLANAAASVRLDVNCRGQSKANKDWSPLHLASYFGHVDIVELLLQSGAQVNAANDTGDTALHKAAYTSRLDIVTLLLKYGADVFTVNGEGLTPKVVTRSSEIRDIIEAAEKSDERKAEELFLKAATAGDNEQIKRMLQSSRPPNIQCIDKLGNTALHCAAYRDRRETAVLLLQNGINTNAVNNNGLRAFDLAQSMAMRHILEVKPVRELQRQVQRFEGPLLKKSKIFGWQQKWVVIERGVLTVFDSRGDASTGMKMRSLKHLDNCKVLTLSRDSRGFAVTFHDGTSHLYSVGMPEDTHVERQRWLNALKSHVAYIAYYTSKGWHDDDDDAEDLLPLGSMQDVLQTAQAHQMALEKEVSQLTSLAARIVGTEAGGSVTGNAAAASGHASACSVKQVICLQEVIAKCAWIAKCSKDMYQSLSHCMTLMAQQEELRALQLKHEEERSRVLTEALHALASEHHSLELQVERRSSGLASGPGGSRPAALPAAAAAAGISSSAAVGFGSPTGSADSSILSPASPDDCDDDDQDEFYECDEFESAVSTDGIDESINMELPSLVNSFDAGLLAEVPADVALGCNKFLRRTHLPAPMLSRGEFSVWSILKQCIGKELSKITMPVVFNEPLSFLQRVTEYLEYADLLEKADACDDPVGRMQYVAAFAVSACASNWNRLGKPFNPLLGETYELDRKELGYRVVCEQVSHHPPVSAFHASSSLYNFYGSIFPKLKFWGKSVEIVPKGTVTVELLRRKEAYSWENVNCAVHNIIVGKLWVEHHGLMTVVNHTTGHRAELNFRKSSLFSRDVHKVDGYVMDAGKNKLTYLYGSWTETFYAVDIDQWQQFTQAQATKGSRATATLCQVTPAQAPAGDEFTVAASPALAESAYDLHIPGQKLLWRASPRPPMSAQYYSFTFFAMMLNVPLPAENSSDVAPTDSRLRPDMRELENGNIDGAAACKERLEEKQRETRKVMKTNNEEWRTRWFHLQAHPHTGKEDWIFGGKYWDRQWKDCPDIF